MAPAIRYGLLVSMCGLWLGCSGPQPALPSGGSAASTAQTASPAHSAVTAEPGATAAASVPSHPQLVRVAAVNTTVSTGLLGALLPEFEKTSGLNVELIDKERAGRKKKGRGHALFKAARGGRVDLIIAHYGKADMAPFVTEGLGEYPRLVFANQAALIGPESDPAQIAGMHDVVAAFNKIAQSGAPYIVNDLDGVQYLSDFLWRAAGQPQKGDWYIEGAEKKSKAVRLAEERNGYVLYGVQPFLRFKHKHESTMKIVVAGDPLLQRAMATVVVNPKRVSGVNHAGALALQRYLLSAATQAKVRTFRMPGTTAQFWWPLARNNNPAELLDKP